MATIIGTEFDDVLLGTSSDDVITGASGADFVDGGPGNDTAVFSGNLADYVISSDNPYGFITVQDLRYDASLSGSPDGTDSLVNIEHLQFADLSVSPLGFTTISDPLEVVGGPGDEILIALRENTKYASAVSLTGGGGDDLLFGRGMDGVFPDGSSWPGTFANYSGDRASYAITTSNTGVTTVQDLRPGSPDGTDTLVRVPELIFSDGPFLLQSGMRVNPAWSDIIVEEGAGTAGVASSTLPVEVLWNNATPAYDVTGWTPLGGSQYSHDETYGAVVLDTAANTVTFTLDDTRAATNALAAGETVFADIFVPVTDGVGGPMAPGYPITFSIAGADDAPTPADDSGTTGFNIDFVVSAATLLANDTDPEGDALSLTAVGGAQNGTVALNAGQVTFTPETGYAGPAGFAYTVEDGLGGTATGTVSVTVNAASNRTTLVASTLNEPLIENGNGVEGQWSAAIALTSGGGVGPLTYDLTGWTGLGGSNYIRYGAYGWVVLDTSAQTLQYVLDDAYAATNALTGGQATSDDFTVTVTDGVTSASAIAAFNIIGSNDAPTALADAATTESGKPVSILAADLVANDSDPESDGLRVTAVGGAQHGMVSLSGGQVTFTPFVGYVGAAGFSYTVDDGHGGTASGQVDVNVTGSSPAYIYRGGQTSPETIDFTGDARAHSVAVGAGDTTVLMGSGGGSVKLDAGSDVVVGGTGKDTITFGPGLGTATGGAGPDAFVFVEGQIADPAAHGGQYDTVTDFTGAGGWVPGRDFIWLKGFAHTTNVTYEHDLSGDPTAHLYRVDDGAYHAEFVLQYAGPGVALALGQFGFL